MPGWPGLPRVAAFWARLRRWLGLAPRWDLFVSYASEDKESAGLITDTCKARGHDPWIDSRQLRFADTFDAEILSAISQSSVFLLLLSRNSVGSAYVSFETSVAIAYGVPIVPVFLDSLERRSLQMPFDRAARRHGHRLKEPLSPDQCVEIAAGIGRVRTRVRRTVLAAWAGVLLLAAGIGWEVQRRNCSPPLKTGFMHQTPGTDRWQHVLGRQELSTGSRLAVSAEAETAGHLFVFWVAKRNAIQRVFPDPAIPGDAAARLTASLIPASKRHDESLRLVPPASGPCVAVVVFIASGALPASELPDDDLLARWAVDCAVRADSGALTGLKGVVRDEHPLPPSDAAQIGAAFDWNQRLDDAFRRCRVAVSIRVFDHVPPDAP